MSQDAYEVIDEFLRNNLDDDDYAQYSKAFENWFTGGDFELKRLGDSYALSSAHNNWQAWQARSARSRTDSIIVEAKG